MLSALGRRLYFPKGILSQGAEAKAKAKPHERHHRHRHRGAARRCACPRWCGTSSISTPARPSTTRRRPGGPACASAGARSCWPRTRRCAASASVSRSSTQAITHGLALAGELFVDPGDSLLLPDKFWENYRLLYEVKLGARIRTFPFFAGRGFDTAGFAQAPRPPRARSWWCCSTSRTTRRATCRRRPRGRRSSPRCSGRRRPAAGSWCWSTTPTSASSTTWAAAR